MNFAEALDTLSEINRLVEELSSSDEPLTPLERLDVYVVADQVAQVVQAVHSSLRHDALVAAAELGVEPGQTRHLAFGTVLRSTRRKVREEWDGYELLNALAFDAADATTGEVMRAVPVETLRTVLPACAKPSATSSRWLISGLQRIGFGGIDNYHRADVELVDTIEVLYADASRGDLLNGTRP